MPAAPPAADAPPGLRLWRENRTPVDKLPGFPPNNSVPKEVTSRTRRYVAGLGEVALAADLEAVARKLREGFGLKRKGLAQVGPDHGPAPFAGEGGHGGGADAVTGSLACDPLTYTVTVYQAEDDPAIAVVRREAEPASLEALTDPALAFAFAPGFTVLERRFDEPADVEAFIDAVEEAEPPEVLSLDYPLDASRCELRLAGFTGTVTVTAESAAVSALTPTLPGDLVKAWALVKGLLEGAR